MSEVEEEDFLKDLDLDLASDDEEDEHKEEQNERELTIINEDIIVAGKRIQGTNDGSKVLEDILRDYIPANLSEYSDLKPSDISRLTPLEPEIARLLSLDTNEQSSLLSNLNNLSLYAQRETTLLHDYMKLLYKQRFPELEDLIPSPLQYANVVYALENARDGPNSNVALCLENEANLSKEQILVLTMSMKMSFKHDVVLSEERRSFLFESRAFIQTLLSMQDRINQFIMSKVSLTAPNVCELVGPKVTSLLLSHAGGIVELSQIPSCNLASIGKNKHLSHELHTNITGIRQEGYIYRSPLVQEQPTQYHKQMLRMACAKVSLAARVDAGMQSSPTQDASLGSRWKNELLEKIQKLYDTSAIRNVKPLPIPVDAPKKKRAGRRFRKYKQQFQLSHLRQLQNRVEFGKQEQTMTDSFGEEIGLGMTKAGLQAVTGPSVNSTGVAKRGVNNSAKLTKAMKRRIEEANERSKEYLLSLDDHI